MIIRAMLRSSIVIATSLLLFVWSGFAQKASTYQAVAKGNRVAVTLEEYPVAFRNPMKGFREFFYPGVDKKRKEYPYPYGSMVKEYMQWNMIEDDPQDGTGKIVAYSDHRWEGVEDINVKVIPRVFLVWIEPWHGGKPKHPGKPDDLGGWHWPKGIPDQKGPYSATPGSWSPTIDSSNKLAPISGGYFHPSFAGRVQALVKKLGEAWDNDPRVAYVEMGIIGEWGEHHDPDLSTFWPPHDEPVHVANRTWIPGMEKILGDAFSAAFKNKKVMVRYAYEFNEYGFGIYWDSWSQPEEQVRGYEEMLKLNDRWRTQPIGGEITWNWGSLAKFKSFEAVVTDPEYFRLTLKQIRNLHCNHLGGITWADFSNPSFATAAADLQKAMGYRFVLESASYPQTIRNNETVEIRFSLANAGSSPFYYNWPLQLILLDPKTKERVWSTVLKNTDITKWQPGDDWNEDRQQYNNPAPSIHVIESFCTQAVPKGKYIIALAIADPAGMLPSLRFANSNYITGGYHPLGYVGIEKKISGFALNKTSFADLQSDTTLHYKYR